MFSNLMQLLFARISVRDESGQAMVEYGLLVALIAVVVAAALTPLGTAIANMFTTIAGQV
jgi:pilus assembly protein Flp/PilA